MNIEPTLSALFSYPVKACGALSHMQIELDERGPIWDRRWMVIDVNDMFVTQREHPAMALIQPTFAGDCLYLAAPGMPTVGIALHREPAPISKVQVWKDVCEAWDEGETLASWLSDYLHTPVRLVRMADNFVRPVDSRYALQPAQTGFSDGFPLLIVSEASLAELNRHLTARGSEPIPMSRFRPNLVVTGCDAFAEDTWRTVQIGSMTLDVVKPCARCVVTTVDQATGTVPDSAEPLATLKTFRQQNNKVMFAQNAIHYAPGTLVVGDVVTVQTTR
ncbi:MAG: MOSC N-terminal beta barrel domain-containing protein [Chloroflexota bacterium]